MGNVDFTLKVKVLSRSVVSDSLDCGPPDSSVHGILQARILEWVAIPFFIPGIKPGSPTLQADSLPSDPSAKPLTLKALMFLLRQRGP